MDSTLHPDRTGDKLASPERKRGWRMVASLNSTILLATTAVVAALEPKMPPYKGD